MLRKQIELFFFSFCGSVVHLSLIRIYDIIFCDVRSIGSEVGPKSWTSC